MLIPNVILSIVEGATELLPISSSGHMLIVSELLRQSLTLELLTYLHFWAGLAILLGYRSELVGILKNQSWKKIILLIGISIIPAGLAGALFDDKITELFYNPGIVVAMLLIWGVIMIYIERVFVKQRPPRKRQIEDIGWWDAVVIGLMETLSLVPGTSRSGITTLAGMVCGIEKSIALDFSFLSGMPLIFGGFFYEMLKHTENIPIMLSFDNVILGLVTFVVAYASLLLLKKYKKTNFLTVFGVYRIFVGILFLVYVLVR